MASACGLLGSLALSVFKSGLCLAWCGSVEYLKEEQSSKGRGDS